jgi:hypothetical protein
MWTVLRPAVNSRRAPGMWKVIAMTYLLERGVLPLERELVAREEVEVLFGTARTKPAVASSTTALRTQTTEGKPSSILCQVFPSSREPNSCPLRVPK